MPVIRADVVYLLCVGMGVGWGEDSHAQTPGSDTSDMTDVVGSLDSRESGSNCLVWFYDSANIVSIITKCANLRIPQN